MFINYCKKDRGVGPLRFGSRLIREGAGARALLLFFLDDRKYCPFPAAPPSSLGVLPQLFSRRFPGFSLGLIHALFHPIPSLNAPGPSLGPFGLAAANG
jgi:hypothetical protein